MDKSDNAYKTIGEVAKILKLKNLIKKVFYQHIQLDFGKHSLNKSSLKF